MSETIEITGENKSMLEELANRATLLYGNLQKVNEEQQSLQKRTQEIQLELHGIASTCKYLLDRAAGGKPYDFDAKSYKIIIKENGNTETKPISAPTGGEVSPTSPTT
jgi:hypothetical protein